MTLQATNLAVSNAPPGQRIYSSALGSDLGHEFIREVVGVVERQVLCWTWIVCF
jgi:hypothetical protein